MAKKIENKPKKKLKVIEQTKEIRSSRKPLKVNDTKKKTKIIKKSKKNNKTKPIEQEKKNTQEEIKKTQQEKKVPENNNLLIEAISKECKTQGQKKQKGKKKETKSSGPKTLMDFINDKSSGVPLPSSEEKLQNLLQKKRSSNKSSKTISQKNDQTPVQSNNSQYNKMFKPKVVLVDGKITIEKPDIGLINKQINEEISKNAIPLESYDENQRITSLSFKKLHHTKKWTESDNTLFYRALSIFGLDFSFLEIVLRPRTRAEILSKYHKEMREQSDLVREAIDSKKDINQMVRILELYKEEDQIKNPYSKKKKDNKLQYTYKDVLLKNNIPEGSDLELIKIVEELKKEGNEEEDTVNKERTESIKEDEVPEIEEEEDEEKDESEKLNKVKIDNTKEEKKEEHKEEAKEISKEKEEKKFVNDILRNFK